MSDFETEAAPGNVEALLLAHPDVASAALIHEEAANGREYPVAYVVPHAERMREARARIAEADQAKRVAQWQKAFDRVYGSEGSTPGPSFVGWTNSYTGKPLPQADMQEWLDGTVERILSLRPEALLEIGCGVGLLAQSLAPTCKRYVGTDLSPIAIGRLRAFAASVDELRHVELISCEATDLRHNAVGSIDTVVLNSVIQYFPDLAYLRQVIAAAVRTVSPGGRIFLGDIRHFGLLPSFHGAVQLAKAPPGASVGWLKRRVALAVEQDRELAIDPRFFLALPGTDPRIGSVDVLVKRGTAYNELTRYRYDVVIHLDGPRLAAPLVQAEWRPDGIALVDIMSRLEAGQLASASITNVPNRRLSADLAILRHLHRADEQQSVEQFRRSLAREAESGRDPEEFWTLAAKRSYEARLSWSPESAEGSIDIAFVAQGSPSHVRATEPSVVSDIARRLATDPLEVAYKQQLGLDLRQMLSDRLPEASCPAAVLAVDALPAHGSKLFHPGFQSMGEAAMDRAREDAPAC